MRKKPAVKNGSGAQHVRPGRQARLARQERAKQRAKKEAE